MKASVVLVMINESHFGINKNTKIKLHQVGDRNTPLYLEVRFRDITSVTNINFKEEPLEKLSIPV